MLAAYWTARLTREKQMTPLADLLVDENGRKKRTRARGRVAKSAATIKAGFDALVVMTGGSLDDVAPEAEPEGG